MRFAPFASWSRLEQKLPGDPRWFQIAFLVSFLTYGLVSEVVPFWEPLLTLPAALTVQLILGRVFKAPSGHWKSGLITGLGLTLLLRTDLIWLAPLVAALAIASKFVLRVRGKHVFNPANGGLAAAMLLTSHAWSSPSQWGESATWLFWCAVLGLIVVVRSLRSDVSMAFLGSWVLLKAGRVLYLGQRPQVLLHQLSIASLIIFTFFMISDPKTTPDGRKARLGFAASVALLAFVLQHGFWIQNAPVWALFVLSPLVPLLDVFLKAPRYHWPSLSSSRSPACTESSSLLPSH